MEPLLHSPLAPTPPLPPVAGWWRSALGWPSRHPGAVPMAGLLSFAAPLKFFVGFLSVAETPPTVDVVQAGLWWLLYGAVMWIALLVAGEVGTRTIPSASRQRRIVAWMLLALACSAVANLATVGRASILMQHGLVKGVLPMLLYATALSFALGLLYFAHLASAGAHERAVARLASAQAAQRQARRRFVQADLQAVQARIDPALLFDMLEAVRGAYATEAARAEHLLDELVAFLRASLPRIRVDASSLAREVELARSYLRLLSLARGQDWMLRLEASGDALHARFPLGAMLPLFDSALRAGGGDCALQAACVDGVCRVTLGLPAAPSDAAVVRVRSLLHETEGPASTLSLAAAGRIVTIRVPHEPA